jgi:valyl-tRNA synthetase
MNVAPGKTLPVILACTSPDQTDLIHMNLAMVLNLARISNLDMLDLTPDFSPPQDSVTAIVSGARVCISLHGTVDPDAEIARLQKEINKLTIELESVEKKLGNQSFLSKAKPEAIEKQQGRQAELSLKLEGLREALEKMRSMKRA